MDDTLDIFARRESIKKRFEAGKDAPDRPHRNISNRHRRVVGTSLDSSDQGREIRSYQKQPAYLLEIDVVGAHPEQRNTRHGVGFLDSGRQRDRRFDFV